MAYDETLAERIRTHLQDYPGLSEKKMFGGLAFLINGHMAVAASGQGGLMVRVEPARTDQLVATSAAHILEMRGRLMPGWLRLSASDVQSDPELAKWVHTGATYASSLPPKPDRP